MTATLGVTGASGYLGQALLPLALAAGWRVIALGRRPVEGPHGFRRVDLREALPADTLAGLTAVIHLAADTSGQELPPGREVAFCTELARACHERGLPLLITSSQAASPTAPNQYGRTKAAIEAETQQYGAILIRPGQVIGGREAGLFGLLVSLVRQSPVQPMLIPRPDVQPIHVDDLATVILAAIARRDLAGECIFAAGEPIPFDQLLLHIGYHRLHLRRVRVPVPASLLRAALTVASRFLGPRLSPERLDSLTRLPRLHAENDLRRLGIKLRPLAEALDRRGSARRVLLHEARTLALATVGRAPRGSLMRRYVRVLNSLDVRDSLGLAPAVLMSATAVASLDMASARRSSQRGDLAWRMDVISRLAEADPQWADGYLPLAGRAGVLRAVTDLAHSAGREVLVRAVAPWARRVGRRST
ncbi:NAD-dependent epimerase/dehydratase family protein [Lysobacter sp. LF1]|uniref:NAD-dependent epimerase/dehydratase family protein n=1 Tax=Lysobacter stagni TaxID=3045172 RepID=A0ABT6XF14_9GAMM|nr:NAD-dependent epimerase/dehydratase family protein [Lysobacter sp. LF1]MDI9238738.1 NAD-dependent epimerase/dehydratase family protein [Lysobacter sp. LF1]